MYRPRGNLTFSRKPSIDPIIGNELAKLARSIPNLSYGDQFPGRQATFGDMHFYTGDDTTSYKKNNWYIRPVDPDASWQSMNATSILAENIQAGTIGSGVKVTDYLSLFGGEMSGEIIFSQNQKINPNLISPGVLPLGVSLTGYVPATGGVYIGDLNFSNKNLSSIGKLYGINNLIYIDMSVAGILSMGSDISITLSSPLINLIGGLNLTGDLAISGDLQVNGTDIGISTDTDLIKLALNLLTINGAETVKGLITLGSTSDLSIGHTGTQGELKTNLVAPSDLHINCGTDKTVVLDETVWRDLWVSIDATRVVGTTSTVMVGNIRELVFSNNDTADFPSVELQHDYKEGTDLKAHLHIATRGTNISAYNVRYTVEYSWADTDGVFPAPSLLDIETTIAGGTAAVTHKFIDLGTIAGTGKHIGSQLKYQLKKIASSVNDAPVANNPYVLQVGLHYEQDTMGSRQVAIK